MLWVKPLEDDAVRRGFLDLPLALPSIDLGEGPFSCPTLVGFTENPDSTPLMSNPRDEGVRGRQRRRSDPAPRVWLERKCTPVYRLHTLLHN